MSVLPPKKKKDACPPEEPKQVPFVGGAAASAVAAADAGGTAKSRKVMRESVEPPKKREYAPPGTAWGSCNLPAPKKKYEVPSDAKPKLKEASKTAQAQGSRLGVLKKEEAFVKHKNPPVPTHKITKKQNATQAAVSEADPKAASAKKATQAHANVVVHTGKKGSANVFDPMAAAKAKQRKQVA